MANENRHACRPPLRQDCSDVPRPILIFIVAKKNGSACYDRRDNGVSRPILFFVVAKKNGPPATAVATTVFRVRF